MEYLGDHTAPYIYDPLRMVEIEYNYTKSKEEIDIEVKYYLYCKKIDREVSWMKSIGFGLMCACVHLMLIL